MIMFGINTGKICFSWLCCVVSLICLVLNPSLVSRSTIKDQQSHLYRSRSFNFTDDWSWLMSSTTAASRNTNDESPWMIRSASLEDIKAYTYSDQWDTCYKPVECPSSIQHRMMSSLSTRHRFHTNVPMILTNESLDNDIYERLKNFKIPFGWRDLNYTDVDDFVSSYNESRSGCLLTETKPKSGCITCAVIGNGGVLKGSGKGKDIDAHDMVFRTNLAVTKGYEEDVGNRTSVYVFSLHTLLACITKGQRLGFEHAPNDEGITYLAFGTEAWDYTYFTSELKSRSLPNFRLLKDKPNVHDYRKPHYFATRLDNKNVKMFHPDFLRYAGWSWVKPKRRNIRKIGAGYRPTTGAFAVVAALHSCDKVDLYGFSNHPENYTEYYFNKKYMKHRNYANHDQRTEAELWEFLDKNRIVSLYKRT